MLLNLIKYKKNTITVSNETTPTSLVDFNTAKTSVSWTPNEDPAWLNINFYELANIQSIDMTFTGTCDEMLIEYSLDNIVWNTLTDIFQPDSATGEIELDYSVSDDIDASFIRIFCSGLSSFVITSLDIYSEITFQNLEYLSHFISSLYSDSEIADFPYLPSFSQSFLEMLENKESKDLRLFDPDDYSSASIAKVITSQQVDLTASDIPIDATIYFWDFDEQISEVTFDQLGSFYDYDGTAYYWLLNYNHTETSYYVWYNVTNGGNTQVDPNLSGKTGIQVDILSADTAANVATKTATELDGVTIKASASSTIMSVTNATSGIRATIVDNDASIDIISHEQTYQTLNPLEEVTNTYIHTGVFVPKLILNYINFQVEFIVNITVT